MVSIKWCCKQGQGIQLVELNENLTKAYLKMAEAAIGTMNREKNYNLSFAISASYYSMYYSLYAILMKIGIKCEIHTCTLKFMKEFLSNFYSQEDFKIIKKGFDLRNIAQYYVEKVIDKKDADAVMLSSRGFLEKSKEVLSRINEKDVFEIRGKLGVGK